VRRVAIRVPCLLVALGTSAAARAELWSLDGKLESRVEYNDNYRLEPRPSGVSTLSLAGGLGMARQTENTKTRLDADLSVLATRPDQQRNEANVLLDLSHSVSAPLDTLAGSFQFHRDSTLGPKTDAGDIGLGRGERRVAAVSASWSTIATAACRPGSSTASPRSTASARSGPPATTAPTPAPRVRAAPAPT
jgi:hypothetical protein